LEYFVFSKNTFVQIEESPDRKKFRKSCSLPADTLEMMVTTIPPAYHVQEPVQPKGVLIESYITGNRFSCESFMDPTLTEGRQSVASIIIDRESIAEIADENQVPDEHKTTVMIRNIPCRYTQDELLAEVMMLDLPFNFLYLPPSRHSGGNLGYAFVNFVEPSHAAIFIQLFAGHQWAYQPRSKKVADPCFAILQGFEHNMQFYAKMKVSKSKKSRPFINREL
jgi:hypothetical protein